MNVTSGTLSKNSFYYKIKSNAHIENAFLMPVLDRSKSKQTEIHLILLRQETIQKAVRKLWERKERQLLQKKKQKPQQLFLYKATLCSFPYIILHCLKINNVNIGLCKNSETT